MNFGEDSVVRIGGDDAAGGGHGGGDAAREGAVAADGLDGVGAGAEEEGELEGPGVLGRPGDREGLGTIGEAEEIDIDPAGAGDGSEGGGDVLSGGAGAVEGDYGDGGGGSGDEVAHVGGAGAEEGQAAGDIVHAEFRVVGRPAS